MISLIFAMDVNNLIGKDNDLPWYYPEDLKYFKKVTKGKPVLMGDNTFWSIHSRLGKPLPNRKNIVATLDKEFKYEGVEVTHDLFDYFATTNEDIFVIGGLSIYKLSLPYADKLYITHINKSHEGNVYFPKINYEDYVKIQSDMCGDLEFAVYERKKKC